MRTELIQASFSKITPQWLAGFFDGEGYVSAWQYKAQYYSISVAITQSDITIISLIALKFKEHDGVKQQKGSTFSKKSCYQLRWNGRHSLELLNYIKDFVIIKKDIVELGIEFANLLDISHNKGKPTPLNITVERHRLAQKIREINQSGR